MTEQPALIASAPKAALSVSWGGFGIGKVLDLLGIHSWADYSYMAAGMLSTVLLLDWIWKKWRARK